jgi:four helix bundle protein
MAPIKDKARTRKGSKMKDTFTHEDLDVYRRAIDFVVVADKVAILLERGRGYLADQLRRASTSIAFNIAEGAGEYNRREKSRFYRIAKRSTTECAAILDVCVRLELSDAEIIEEGRELLLRIVAMLTRLIRSGSDSNASTNAVPA